MDAIADACQRRDPPARRLSDHERSGLPGWTYFNRELHELEAEQIFRRHWQLVGHESEIAEAGNT